VVSTPIMDYINRLSRLDLPWGTGACEVAGDVFEPERGCVRREVTCLLV